MGDESKRLPKISFSQEWDKLGELTFTTIRSWNEEKERYYRGLIGSRFEIVTGEADGRLLKNPKTRGHAFLRSVRRLNPRTDISGEMLTHDVLLNGKPDGVWLSKLIQMKDGLLLTFDRAPEVTLD